MQKKPKSTFFSHRELILQFFPNNVHVALFLYPLVLPDNNSYIGKSNFLPFISHNAISIGLRTFLKTKFVKKVGFMQLIKLKRNLDCKDVILLQPTSYVGRILDEAINYFKKEKYNSMFSGNIIKKPCYWKKHNKSLLLV